MTKSKKSQIRAKPPMEFECIDNICDIEKLNEIYAKLETLTAVFSEYKEPNRERLIASSEVYGFWFIFRDICEDLAEVLKLKYWK